MKARKRRIKYWAYKSQIAQGLVIIIICMAIIIIMVFSLQLQVSFARRPQQWLCLRLERKWELRPKVISSQKHNHIRKALYPHNHNKSHHHHYHLSPICHDYHEPDGHDCLSQGDAKEGWKEGVKVRGAEESTVSFDKDDNDGDESELHDDDLD